MSEIWPAKDPDEILDFDVDWTRRLWSEAEALAYADAIAADPAKADDLPSSVQAPADTIASSTFTLPTQTGSNQLVANSSTFTSSRTKVWLAGGVEGSAYAIVNRIVTSGGRTMDQTIKLRIKTK